MSNLQQNAKATARKNQEFEIRLANSRRRSSTITRQWRQTEKLIQASAADLEYWMLFVYGKYNPPGDSRRKVYLMDYDIAGKIVRMKEAGTWPPAPTHNQNMLHLYLLAYQNSNGMELEP